MNYYGILIKEMEYFNKRYAWRKYLETQINYLPRDHTYMSWDTASRTERRARYSTIYTTKYRLSAKKNWSMYRNIISELSG